MERGGAGRKKDSPEEESIVLQPLYTTTSSQPQVDLAQALLQQQLTDFQEALGKSSLEEIDSPQEKLDQGLTCLEYCCTHGLTEYADALLRNGASVGRRQMGMAMGQRRSASTSPLHLAIQGAHPDIVSLLLSHGAPVNQPDCHGRTPLHVAASLASPSSEASQKCLQLLLAHPKLVVDLRDREGNTALSEAARDGRQWVARILLKHGADPQEDELPLLKGMSVFDDEPDVQDPIPFFENIEADGIDMSKGMAPFSLPVPAVPFSSGEDKLNGKGFRPQPRMLRMATPIDLRGAMFSALYAKNCDKFKDLVAQLIARSTGVVNLNANNGRYTLLQYTCVRGLDDCVETLIKAGADPNGVCRSCPDTPALLAARKGFHRVLKILWDCPETDYRATDEEGETVLHRLVLGGPKVIYTARTADEEDVYARNHEHCLQDLLERFQDDERRISRLDLNARDNNGNTALHLSSGQSGYEGHGIAPALIVWMVRLGANLCVKNKNHVPAVANLPASVIDSCFDEGIILGDDQDEEADDEDLKRERQLSLSFLPLMPSPQFDSKTGLFLSVEEEEKDRYLPETELMWHMAKSPQLSAALKHPLTASFLYLKWERVRMFFFLNLLLYMLYVSTLTAYLLKSFGKDAMMEVSNSTDTSSTEKVEKEQRIINVLMIMVAVFTVWLAVRETFQLATAGRSYIQSPENWLETTLVILTVLLILAPLSDEIRRHMAALALLLSWSELVFLVGQHPILTSYVHMFTTVTYNYLSFLVAFFLFIFAFALSFHILFHTCPPREGADDECDDAPFRNPFEALLKTLLMMLGGFELSQLPLEPLRGTSHLVLLLFLFLVVLVLVNLFNGLAVSDTQAIREQAEVYSLSSRVHFIFYVESMLLGRPLDDLLPFHRVCPDLCYCCHFASRLRKLILSRVHYLRRFLLFPSLRGGEARVLSGRRLLARTSSVRGQIQHGVQLSESLSLAALKCALQRRHERRRAEDQHRAEQLQVRLCQQVQDLHDSVSQEMMFLKNGLNQALAQLKELAGKENKPTKEIDV